MKLYSVINMDIVGSRKIENRENFQEGLISYFNELNLKYNDILVSPITITLGDEWQIVLNKPEESYNLVNKIRFFLLKHSVQVYSGIGIGEISTLVYESPLKMDGEAFILAREALNIAKDRNNSEKNSSRNRVYFNGIKHSLEGNISREIAITSDDDILSLSFNSIINTIIENNEIILSKMTEKQIEAIILYKEYGTYNKIIAANKANSKSSISQRLSSSEYLVFEKNSELINTLLKRYSEVSIDGK